MISHERLKGTFLDKRNGLWGARITVKRKTIFLGRFRSVQEAHEAYKKAAMSHFGSLAKLEDGNYSNTKHGMCGTKTWSVWSGMVGRIGRPSNTMFPFYGGQGIDCDPRWLDFANFISDMGECPAGMTLERKDNSLGYWPGNCRWATYTEQANNRRNTSFLTLAGERDTRANWPEDSACLTELCELESEQIGQKKRFWLG